jgi:hypothetical protein
MRSLPLAAALLLTLVAAPEALDESSFPFSDSLQRSFAPSGAARLDLSAGRYRIRRGEDNRVRVSWRTRTAEQMDDTRVRVSVHDREAVIRTSGPRRDFRVEIELPARTDVLLRMSAGDLTIAGIEGNKDVLLRAGNLHIEVPDAAQYRQVRASVTAGDLSARPFGFSTGGLFRSFAYNGRGRFNLRARLWAGDLRLVPPKVESAAR